MVGATIQVINDDTSELLFNDLWQGYDITFDIDSSVHYTVTVGNIVGYITPDNQTYQALPTFIRNIDFIYFYKLGVFIESVDNKLYKKELWNNSKVPNSIVVFTSNKSFRIALTSTHPTKTLCGGWGSNGTAYCTAYPNGTALNDFNGVKNTDDIIRLNQSENQYTTDKAAVYCKSYTFPDGVTKGYLPSCGEWTIVINNINEINSCLGQLNAATISNSDYWLSTLVNYATWCWWCHGHPSYVDYNGGDGSYYGDGSKSVCIFGSYS